MTTTKNKMKNFEFNGKLYGINIRYYESGNIYKMLL